MADLTDLQAAETVKLAGANPTTGVENNYVTADSNGSLFSNLRSSSGAELGTTTNPIVGATQNLSGTTAIVLSAVGDFFLQTGMLKYSGLIFNVSGTWSGTIRAKSSFDGGSTYSTMPVVQFDTALSSTITDVTANGSFYVPIVSDTVKISFDIYTSGTATVRTSFTTGVQDPSLNPLLAQIARVGITNTYVPNLPYTVIDTGSLVTDNDNQLITRGDVLTDEGTFRDDFIGVAIDATKWTTSSTGTGASISVGSSLVNLVSGTSNNAQSAITTSGDYGPISLRFQSTLSQRIANQTTRIGFADNITTPTIGAYFEFTGTSNTVVNCISRSSSAAADTQTTLATIPNGTSATSNDYYVEVQPDQITFFINGFQVANHKLHLPGPYDILDIGAKIVNSAVVTTTTLSIDYIYFINQNSLQINNSFIGDDLPVKIKQGTVSTYGAAATGLVVAASATDIFTITGSATKTIKIKHISVDGTQTTASNINLQLIKRSTANTGGTSTTLTAVPFDSFNSAATATVRTYTANPTLGTAVGTIHSEKLFVPTATTLGDEYTYKPQDSNSQEITLRGTNEVLAVNLNGTTVSGSSFNLDIVWTEE